MLLAGSLTIAGCGSPDGPSEPAANPQDCETAAQIEIPTGASTVALVTDNTASDAGGGLPPATEEKLRHSQREGHQLVIVAVEGDGVNPTIRHRIALDPYPEEDSPRADKARAIVIGCVAAWFRAPQAQPSTPQSDILAAIGAAAREQPTEILVVSDGLGTAGGFDVNRHGFEVDLATFAQQARNSVEPGLHGTTIVWSGLGNATVEIPQPLRNSLQGLWEAVLTEAGASVTFDNRSGAPAVRTDEPPADTVTVPTAVYTRTECATEVILPTSLLFEPGSPRMLPGSTAELRVVAAQLVGNDSWTAVVSGHTAHYGSDDYRRTLSDQRADAVVDALVGMAVDRRRLTAVGHGSDEPAVDEFPGGVHDEAAAAMNRRVVIELLPAGCTR